MPEARNWHSMAYGGSNSIARMEAEEIGHAAAYEAYRIWMHNPHMYQSFLSGCEQQREALVGLAVAEAVRILEYSGHGMDMYGRELVTECAAATASRIFYDTMDTNYYPVSHHDSFNPYLFDDSYHHHHHHRHHSSDVVYLNNPYPSYYPSYYPPVCCVG